MEKIIRLLKEFHFTESESKVYISLLENGSGTGYEISKFSGVSNSKIYNILENLMQRGVLSNSQRGKSTVYRAEPISKVATLLKLHTNQAIKELERAAGNLASPYEDEKIWNLVNHSSIIANCIELIESAQDHIMIQIWVNELNHEIENALIQKQKELDKVLVILYDEHEQYHTRIDKFYAHGFEEDKLHDTGTRWITLTVDGKEMLYASFDEFDVLEGISTRNQRIVYFAQEYIAHDAYCLKLIDMIKGNDDPNFIKGMSNVRNIFSK